MYMKENVNRFKNHYILLLLYNIIIYLFIAINLIDIMLIFFRLLLS